MSLRELCIRRPVMTTLLMAEHDHANHRRIRGRPPQRDQVLRLRIESVRHAGSIARRRGPASRQPPATIRSV